MPHHKRLVLPQIGTTSTSIALPEIHSMPSVWREFRVWMPVRASIWRSTVFVRLVELWTHSRLSIWSWTAGWSLEQEQLFYLRTQKGFPSQILCVPSLLSRRLWIWSCASTMLSHKGRCHRQTKTTMQTLRTTRSMQTRLQYIWQMKE